MIDRPLQTFSVAFKDRAFSELDYARQVATAIKADSHEVVIDDQDFFGALPRLIWHEDEPIAHPSSIPLYFVSALARDHVKVVLTGEGSDELLAGYGKYPRALANWRAGAAYERLPSAMRRWMASMSCRTSPAEWGVTLPGRFSICRARRKPCSSTTSRPSACRRQSGCSPPRVASLRHSRTRVWTVTRLLRCPNGRSTTLDRLLYADMKTYLVELLMKQDQMSMAASIESRVPFLDHHLVEFAAGLPTRMKLRGLTTKWILREAVREVLPPEILTRKKMGFPVPFGVLDARAVEGHSP